MECHLWHLPPHGVEATQGGEDFIAKVGGDSDRWGGAGCDTMVCCVAAQKHDLLVDMSDTVWLCG